MALATVDDVAARIEEDITPALEKLIVSALEEASDLARYYGKEWESEEDAPPTVRRIVAAAAARWVRNPDGFSQNRAGDESLSWHEVKYDPGTIYLTDLEVERIQRLVTPVKLPGFGSIQMQAWGGTPASDEIRVPWGNINPDFETFPLYSTDDPFLPFYLKNAGVNGA